MPLCIFTSVYSSFSFSYKVISFFFFFLTSEILLYRLFYLFFFRSSSGLDFWGSPLRNVWLILWRRYFFFFSGLWSAARIAWTPPLPKPTRPSPKLKLICHLLICSESPERSHCVSSDLGSVLVQVLSAICKCGPISGQPGTQICYENVKFGLHTHHWKRPFYFYFSFKRIGCLFPLLFSGPNPVLCPR